MGLGLHGGGVGTVKFLAREEALVTVTDKRNAQELRSSLAELTDLKNVRYVLGRHLMRDFRETDLVVKNPGVVPGSPYLQAARHARIRITNDLGIFFRRCPATIIGVTGTRGKSTTAHLIWKFLRTRSRRVFLAGNIRKSPLDFLDTLKRGDLVILELSSFQLEDLSRERMSPHIAVITNIFRDHLNWHKTMRAYIAAKRVIVRFQKPGDYCFANPDDPRVRAIAACSRGKIVYARLPAELRKIVDGRLGEHYRPAVALAARVARHYGIPMSVVEATLDSFRELEGRQEIMGIFAGIHWVNDTTATIPDATIKAIERFRRLAGAGEKTHLILIAGGQDKNLDYRAMARAIENSVDTVILLPGTATVKLKRFLPQSLTIFEANTMAEAVQLAAHHAKRGDYVLLSPGAASFGLFLNEFDRGAQFKDKVKMQKSK